MKIETLEIDCEDDYKLGANLFLPISSPRAVLQLNSATATPQSYYSNFAKYLVDQRQFAVLTFDYRGIGASKPASGLKGFKVEYTDWATLDMAAVSSFLNKRFPTIPLLQFGHSVGGQMMGLVPNIGLSKGLVTVGSAAGSTKNTVLGQKIQSTFFFEIVRPVSNLLFGYGRLKAIGLMEDLPKNLLNTWRNWCSVSDYFFDPKYYGEIKEIDGYKDFKIPIEIIVATDDRIATKSNVENFWKHAKSTKGINVSYLNPSDYGGNEIGHFGFFRRKFETTLWPLALDKLEKMTTI